MPSILQASRLWHTCHPANLPGAKKLPEFKNYSGVAQNKVDREQNAH